MKSSVLQWLFLIFYLQIISMNNISFATGQCMRDQQSLLLHMRRSLAFNTIASTKLVTWNQSRDCCEWAGVECDGSGHVISLFLNNEAITDGIDNSSSLFSLGHLQRLNLAFNRFNSIPIPPQLYNLTNLTYLNLSNSGFGGQIPTGLSRLTRLDTLDLSNIFPIGQPLALENPNLKQFFDGSKELRELYLDGVNISAQTNGWCQAISSTLPKLRVLSLKSCRLSGPIDPSLLKLRFLSEIYLDRNNLSTVVPEFLANFSNLKILSLSSCNLKGAFPVEIFRSLWGLEELVLEYNQDLIGELAPFPENRSLRKISVSNTQFSGQLPTSISNLSNLSRIDISYCKFSGSIPSTMGKLKSLSYVDFSFNNFSGSMPNFQWSHNLAYIDFSGNALTGPLSFNHFKGLSEIVYINLGSNFLSGRIPPSLFSLPSLQKLLLSNNSFDQVDAYLTASPASQLDTLDLSFNNIKGSIQKYFFDLSNLKVLTLSSNSFGGSIQFNNLHSLPNLTRLELSRNNLSVDVSGSASSSFPQITTLTMASCRLKKFPDLRNQSRLMHLDLSDNEIRGKVPYWIWDVGNGRLSHLNLSYNFLEDLEKPYTIPRSLYLLDLQHNQLQGQLPMMPGSSIIYLDYSHNRFNGSIPIDIGNINIVFLSLSNNSFMGRIPISICNASYLLVLDLSHNKLSGPLPSCLLGTIGTLGVLNLRDNQIIGNIPDSFPSDCALKTLDLSENFLQGRIPKSLVNCSSLEVLNIGKNKIVDTFPCQLKNISSLQVLVLRSNGFHGHLHCVDNVNLTWPSFQLFDIADNHFNGKLPSNFFLSLEGMIGSQNPVTSGSHIRFKYLSLSKWYYESRVMVTMKANEIELVKILKIFTYLDFSSNNFDGIIPSTIGALDSLYVLNLSHNSLTGIIPKTIGDLKTMESLDLSGNELHGPIPPELGNLTFLSYLNLSHNRLSGVVPAGDQLNTFDEKSYLGNPGLCGLPLLNSCESPPVSRGDESEREADYGEAEMDWEPTALGFLLGLGVYLWMLFRNKRCWEAYEQLDEILGRLFSQRKVRRLSPGR